MSDPFRDGGHGRSQTLERLATRTPAAAAIAEIDRVPAEDRDKHLGEALNMTTPIGCLAAVGYLAAIAIGILWLTGTVAAPWLFLGAGAIAAGHVAHSISRMLWQRRVERRLAWVDHRPFPITGVRGYLSAARPMIDVTFEEVPLAGTVIAGFRGHAPDAEVSQIDDYTFRVVLPTGDPAGPRADDAALRRFVDEVLVPVHAETGITAVALGGQPPPLQPQLAAPEPAPDKKS